MSGAAQSLNSSIPGSSGTFGLPDIPVRHDQLLGPQRDVRAVAFDDDPLAGLLDVYFALLAVVELQ